MRLRYVRSRLDLLITFGCWIRCGCWLRFCVFGFCVFDYILPFTFCAGLRYPHGYSCGFTRSLPRLRLIYVPTFVDLLYTTTFARILVVVALLCLLHTPRLDTFVPDLHTPDFAGCYFDFVALVTPRFVLITLITTLIYVGSRCVVYVHHRIC